MNQFKITLTSTLIVLATCVPSVSATPTVGPDGHYYDYVPAPAITWDDANSAAIISSYLGLTGHLVTITSAVEDSLVDALLTTALPSGGEAWAGGYQNPITETDPKAGWTWVNGEGSFPGVNSAGTYSNWAVPGPSWPQQPDDAFGPGSEQYLGLHLFGPGLGWNDEGNTGEIGGYVVEYQLAGTVPESGSLNLVNSLTVGALLCFHRFPRRSLRDRLKQARIS